MGLCGGANCLKRFLFGFCTEDLPSEKSAQSIVVSLGYLRKQSLFFTLYCI